MYDHTTHLDFEKYYDTTLKRNIWLLGYFGGGAVNIVDAMNLAKQYVASTGVTLESVKIDEIFKSRWCKSYKFLYSNEEQVKETDVKESEVFENVFEVFGR